MSSWHCCPDDSRDKQGLKLKIYFKSCDSIKETEKWLEESEFSAIQADANNKWQ